MPGLCRYARGRCPTSRHRLAERTLELVDIPSESRHEAEIAARVRFARAHRVRTRVRGGRCVRLDAATAPSRPLVLLAGHYDTVPAQDNVPGRIEDGAVIGLGATRHEGRRGGDARARPGARAALTSSRTVDVALLLFGKEELPAQFSPLPDLFDNSRVVHEADLAILLEPTDLTIQAGCLGNLNARITFHGVSGHSARPWTAENAIEKALDGLAPIAALERREAVEIGGLPFYEVVEHHADRGRDRRRT